MGTQHEEQAFQKAFHHRVQVYPFICTESQLSPALVFWSNFLKNICVVSFAQTFWGTLDWIISKILLACKQRRNYHTEASEQPLLIIIYAPSHLLT